jgi:hypothetical protein
VGLRGDGGIDTEVGAEASLTLDSGVAAGGLEVAPTTAGDNGGHGLKLEGEATLGAVEGGTGLDDYASGEKSEGVEGRMGEGSLAGLQPNDSATEDSQAENVVDG